MSDKVTRESKGVAFVLFADKQTALKAVAMFHGKEVCLVRCSILP